VKCFPIADGHGDKIAVPNSNNAQGMNRIKANYLHIMKEV
jgi:hypothetical protein